MRGAGLMVAGALALAAACGGTEIEDDAREIFRALPLPLDHIACVHPLGEIDLPGDALGRHDALWDVHERGACGTPVPFTGEPVPVFAAANGTIVTVDAPARTATIAVNADLEYTYRGVALDGFLLEGTPVAAGQRLGVVADPDSGLRFAVTDYTFVNEWIAEERYPDRYRHARHAAHYYDPVQSDALDALSSDPAAPDGRLAWDVAGTLAGNWFAEGTPRSAQAVAPDAWPGHLAFQGTTTRRIGAGTALGGGCRCAPRASDPAFTSITPTSGIVSIGLRDVAIDGTTAVEPRGTLLVQLLSADRVRVEFFEGPTDAVAFTAAARIYLR